MIEMEIVDAQIQGALTMLWSWWALVLIQMSQFNSKEMDNVESTGF